VDREEFLSAVRAVNLGKKLPDGVYVHRDALAQLVEPLAAAVERAVAMADLDESSFNVVRFSRTQFRLSLLSYPQFFEVAFPELAASWAVDLEAGRVRRTRFGGRSNTPILHRKDVLLPTGHPRREEFASLTREAERLGLLDGSAEIGNRAAWEARLERLGITVSGNRFVEGTRRNMDTASAKTDEEETVAIHRHRTAMQRYSLSTPMQALYRSGLLDGRHTVFDYGCGRGDDLRILPELGVQAHGWDPHYAGSETLREADVVNLGFVINVIEKLTEREEALRRAFSLAKRLLAVSALIGGRTVYEERRLYADGVLTLRGTFQKYFQQQELRQYIESVLGREPIAIGPGLFFVFRDDDEEQDFLASRQIRGRCAAQLPRAEPRPRVPRVTRWEAHRALLDDFWQRCLQLGRLPRPPEYTRFDELRMSVGSPKAVLTRLIGEQGQASLERARRGRMSDILVYLALNTFERRRSRQRIAPALRPDVVAFWGGASAAQEDARRLLFSIADTSGILEACHEAAALGLGYLDGDHSLTFAPSHVDELASVLRVYVQAGLLLYGDPDEIDLVKIHVHSGKLTLMRFDGFRERALPALRERIKINLRHQVIDFFPGPAPDAQLCFPKSRYLPRDHADRDRLSALEQRLLAEGLERGEYGCAASALEAVLARSRLHLDDASLELVARSRLRAPAASSTRTSPKGGPTPKL
jgi:DNA phosphorothioation-associated putative methyltransferase